MVWICGAKKKTILCQKIIEILKQNKIIQDENN